MGPAPWSVEEQVLLVAPTHRDAEVTCALLNAAGVNCVACGDLHELAQRLGTGAGAIILTDTSLADPAMAELQGALAAQPAWSDIPTVLLTHDRERTPVVTRAIAALANVTLLDRPSSTRSMVSAVQSALRSRRRQYQIRDQLIQQAKAEEALREADLRKDVFLATLAHELRNPLAAIFSGAQVLNRRDGDPDVAARMVAMIDRQSRLLVKLIDDLLDVSRIATGKLILQKERLDMSTVVAAALETVQTVLLARRHNLRVIQPATPLWVIGDASRLAQVVGNLLNNAVKYTPEAGRITVSLSEEDGQAVLRVADDGVGIPADMLPRVFEMFTQVDKTLDRAQGGLGIGLSLVLRLMELHGGVALAESEGAGKGSVFTIKLPLAAQPDAGKQAGARGSLARGGSRRRLRILIVDDNADVADSLAAFLKSDSYDIRIEYSGAAGLAAADEFDPHVVFCDVGMPGIDGHQVAAHLRADGRHAGTVLVAITGWGTEEHRRRNQDAGFDVHLTKPVDLHEVERILANI